LLPRCPALRAPGLLRRLEVADAEMQNIDFGVVTGGEVPVRTVKLANRSARQVSFELVDEKRELTDRAVAWTPGPGTTQTLKPKESCDVELRFAPTHRITPFRFPLYARCNNGFEVKLLQVAGTGHSTEVRLSEQSLFFGSVVVGSQASRSLRLHNFGDIGAKFRFEVPERYRQVFSVSPSEGFARPQEDVSLTVTFTPTADKQQDLVGKHMWLNVITIRPAGWNKSINDRVMLKDLTAELLHLQPDLRHLLVVGNLRHAQVPHRLEPQGIAIKSRPLRAQVLDPMRRFAAILNGAPGTSNVGLTSYLMTHWAEQYDPIFGATVDLVMRYAGAGPLGATLLTLRRIGWDMVSSQTLRDDLGRHYDLLHVCPADLKPYLLEGIQRWQHERLQRHWCTSTGAQLWHSGMRYVIKGIRHPRRLGALHAHWADNIPIPIRRDMKLNQPMRSVMKESLKLPIVLFTLCRLVVVPAQEPGDDVSMQDFGLDSATATGTQSVGATIRSKDHAFLAIPPRLLEPMGEFRWPSAVLTYNAKHKSLVFTSLVFHSLVVNTTLATVIVVARLPTLTVI
ncbi:unnamed protein product, partial [Prorocentrum cordatum]